MPAASSQGVDPLIGRTVNGRFKVTSLIARGGMGRVYRAEQAPLGRVCALKVLTTTYEGEHDPEFHKRFFLEASIASKITHPNSVTIFDYGHTEDDIYYMAMEYLEGVTLHRAIRLSGYFSEARVAHIGRQVCRALREAHALGCIHRDLKPANIFLTEHGDEPDFVKVLDFGLVKNVAGEGASEEQLTQTGLFMGSPKYMAPEQIRGERVDARTDVYSLGIIMFEMLTGKVPFERLTSLNTLMAQVNDAPPRLRDTNAAVDVSPEMEDLVLQCMAKDPAQRVASMDDVLAVLRRFSAPGMNLTGEYRALGPSASGAYARALGTDPTPGPSRPPLALAGGGTGSGTATARPSAPGSSRGAAPSFDAGDASDSPSVSVSVSSASLGRPSLTPMIDGGGGGALSVHPDASPAPDFRQGNRKRLGVFAAAAFVVGIVGFLALRGISGSETAALTPEPGPVAAPLTTAGEEGRVASGASRAADSPPNANGGANGGANAAGTPNARSSPPPQTGGRTVPVHFVTDPPGASVKEGVDEICAATPCDFGFATDPGAGHTVVVSRTGYRPETRVVHATDAQLALTLVPVRAWVPPRAAAGAGGANASKPKDPSSAAPQGFKDIPY